MAGRDLDVFARKLAEYDSASLKQNLHAQAHARAILIDSDTPSDQWPPFSLNLDKRLYYGANLLISGGLELIEGENFVEQAETFLTSGAEAIEFLYNSIDSFNASPREELLKAAIAYHIASRHARAYVLMDRLKQYPKDGSGFSELLIAILERKLEYARRQTIHLFEEENSNDATIAVILSNGEISQEEAVDRLGKRSLTQAVSFFLEYLKIGRRDYLSRAIEITLKVEQLAKDAYDVNLWWTARMLRHMLKEFGDSSLWNCLSKFSPEGTDNFMIQKYIQSSLIKEKPITNLWPSQIKALEWILHPDKPSFGVRMPTSAGKTKIAELTILNTILDSQEDSTKCIYIAPYRSLAIEVEQTLRSGLGPLGIKVSEVYGGFDMSYAEQRLIDENSVLIATPEKFDALIRQTPEIITNIKLLIVDEGHIAGHVSERGIGAEFLLNRLLLALPRERCRYLFISAVLPNAKDFARWIAGDETNLVESDWRPSRLMIGECQWNGSRIRLSYTHDTEREFQQECFVHKFIEKQECRRLPGVGGRRNPFPHYTKEAFALSAIRFAQDGTTLAFIPQAQHVESVGKEVLKALKLQSAIDSQHNSTCELPKPDRTSSAWQNCVEVIKEDLGVESVLLEFLNAGFVVHHSKLPARVRFRTEELIRTNQVKLIIATTTLAQGVNLPIRTILVRGLQQGQDSVVDSLEFWNIAGRAGRAMYENEGQILFFIDETGEKRRIRRLRNQHRVLIERNRIADVLGVMYFIIGYINNLWQQSDIKTDFALLCIKLAEDDFDWVEATKRSNFEEIMALLDQHLLALCVEANITPDTLDELQNALRESLLFAEIGIRPISGINEDTAASMLKSRVMSIYRRIPNHTKRERFYKLGLSLNDCNAIETNATNLFELFMQASEWDNWEYDKRINFLCTIANEAMKLETVHKGDELQFETTRGIIGGWLEGKTPLEIIAENQAPTYDNPSKLSKFIENLCVYKLAWVVNSIYVYLVDKQSDLGSSLPDVCNSFSAMFKYGVCTPLATVFVAYLNGNRKLSSKAALASPYGYERVDRALAWLLNSSIEDLCNGSLLEDDGKRIIELRRNIEIWDRTSLEVSSMNRFTVKKLPDTSVNVGDNVLIIPRPEKSRFHYDVISLTGEILWRLKRKDGFPKWWLNLYTIDARIHSINSLPDGRFKIKISVDKIGS